MFIDSGVKNFYILIDTSIVNFLLAINAIKKKIIKSKPHIYNFIIEPYDELRNHTISLLKQSPKFGKFGILNYEASNMAYYICQDDKHEQYIGFKFKCIGKEIHRGAQDYEIYSRTNIINPGLRFVFERC